MVRIHALHRWDVSLAEAAAIQRELAGRVVTVGEPADVRLVAGVDVGFPGGVGRGVIALLRYPELTLVEAAVAELAPPFPYVPGYLSFREVPILAAAFARLAAAPDLVLVDGQGIAHPRRLGSAAHLGLLLDLPTIGCAKSRLIGTGDEPGPERGGWAPLLDRGAVIGARLRTRRGVNPLYISVGHRISLAAAIDWTLRCATRYRLPEPIRLADQMSKGK